MNMKPIAVIHVDRENRGDTLYLSSKDLPGLWLWGKDPDQLFKSIAPTIEKLYEYNEGLKVEIKEICQRGILGSWFGKEKVCDTFEVYSTNLGENVIHGQNTVEL